MFFHRFVYYEADTFATLRNPFIDVNVPDPSLAQLDQKILRGENVKFNYNALYCGLIIKDLGTRREWA